MNRTVIVLLCAALSGSIAYSLHDITVKNNVITRIAINEKELQLSGVVIRDPSPTSHGGISFIIRTRDVSTSHHHWKVRVPVRIFTSGKAQQRIAFHIGEVLVLHGQIAPSRERKVAANFFSTSIKKIHRAPPLLMAAEEIRTNFRNISKRFHSDAGALIPGMVLGDTSLQTDEFSRVMRRVGLTHITAVSGANFALVASFILWLTQWWIRTMRYRIFTTCVVLSFFILVVRPSSSVLRASVMSGALLFARARGGNSSSAPALGAALTFLLLCDPFQSMEPGFILSVLATAGILFLAPVITTRLSQLLPDAIAEAIAIPTSATALCSPLIVALSGQLSFATIPVNVFVAPLIGPITVGGFIGAIVATLAPYIAHYVLMIVIAPTTLIVWIAHYGAYVPTLSLSPILALAAMALLVGTLSRRSRFLVVLLLCGFTIAVISPLILPVKPWQIFQCDVGQGDALIYRTGDHRAIVIDTGPDPQLIDRCLSSLKINEIDLLVITHSHADHAGGIGGVANHRIIHEVWANFSLPSIIDGVPHRSVHAGESYDISTLRITILWPEVKTFDGPALPGDGSAENNKSIVMLIDNDGVTLMTTGDIEPPAQAQIEHRFSSHIDILKVPHHGSRYQDFHWLELLRPTISLISVGRDNSYGHPAEITVRDLVLMESAVHRTDREGAIAVDWNKDSKALKFRIRREGRRWWKVRLM